MNRNEIQDRMFSRPMLSTLVECSTAGKIPVKDARRIMVALFKVAYRAGVADGIGKKEAMLGGEREEQQRDRILGVQARMVEETQ